eukprot:3538625-Pleurochrysis_carterae.AAC.1
MKLTAAGVRSGGFRVRERKEAQGNAEAARENVHAAQAGDMKRVTEAAARGSEGLKREGGPI